MSDGMATGAYTAERASALSGVPKSTIHYWARKDILVPSVSSERVKLWSYSDLLGLRTIYALRQPKTLADGRTIPQTTMQKVRLALSQLRRLDLSDWDERAQRILVDANGHVYLRMRGDTIIEATGTGQTLVSGFDLTAPMKAFTGALGPDLRRPRENLRIVPGKLSGSPHIESTRLQTLAIAALRCRGFSVEKIHSLYPFAHRTAIQEAVDLEAQLEQNLQLRAA